MTLNPCLSLIQKAGIIGTLVRIASMAMPGVASTFRLKKQACDPNPFVA